MPSFDSHSREQLRRAYAAAWAKHLAGVPLAPLEFLIVDVIGIHPEYRHLVRDAATAAGFAADGAGERDNPFLHMGLHIAVREQLAIDRPPGVCTVHRQLQSTLGDAHSAEHILMEALGTTLWQAQRDQVAPDESRYLDLARRLLNKG